MTSSQPLPAAKHPLHDYVARQLAEKLEARKILVLYDPRRELVPFVDELRAGEPLAGETQRVAIGGLDAHLAEYTGSLFALRAMVEPLVGGDDPEHVLLYLPGCERDPRGSVLMELELAGMSYESQLRKLARNVLRRRYSEGIIDELAPEGATYQDLARAASEASSTEPPSILKAIFHDAVGKDGLLAAWLASEARDTEIATKGATRELVKLVRSCVGLALAEDATLAKLRALVLRYVLGGEFRSDLACPPPPSLGGIPSPATKGELAALRALARRLRKEFPDAYPAIADRVENELHLRDAPLPASALGSIDTFRFEERALLAHCGELVAGESFDQALGVIGQRENSFWLDRDLARKAQWEACRRMAELGRVAVAVRSAIATANGDAAAWIAVYTAEDGWYRLDRAQRRLEAWLATLDEDSDERALAVVRRAYEAGCQAMAEGFTRVFERGGFLAPGTLHQTRIYSELVASRPRPVAYLLVDAMRYEMGLELAQRLPPSAEVTVKAAVAALPSITPVGMAALQPGAAASFSIVEQGGKLGARIDDAFLPDLAARQKLAAARVPRLADLALDQLLSLSASKLAKKVEGAQVVVVRSQEIDHAGEAGFILQARQVMDTVIDNLVRAIRRLAAAGIEHMVVTADHGHLFFPTERDVSMRIDAPGGATVDLHRRCWIGRGGATPPGCLRVSAAELGYASDLDLVFPRGAGVFKAGGDLAYHHGGLSLQELVLPVVTVRLPAAVAPATGGSPLRVSGAPEAITNRIFSIKLELGGANLALFGQSLVVHPQLIAGGSQVGAAGVAVDAELERATGHVTLHPGKPASVGLMLTDDTASALRIVVLDPSTGAELYRSPADIPVRLGV